MCLSDTLQHLDSDFVSLSPEAAQANCTRTSLSRLFELQHQRLYCKNFFILILHGLNLPLFYSVSLSLRIAGHTSLKIFISDHSLVLDVAVLLVLFLFSHEPEILFSFQLDLQTMKEKMTNHPQFLQLAESYLLGGFLTLLSY